MAGISNSMSTSMASLSTDQLLQPPSLNGLQRGLQSKQDAKIEKAGKDFESILLGSWLQKAEQSFATVPGGDEDGDDDVGKEQFQSMAMQSLAGSLTASGGIGIAHMITEHLKMADRKETAGKEPPAGK